MKMDNLLPEWQQMVHREADGLFEQVMSEPQLWPGYRGASRLTAVRI